MSEKNCSCPLLRIERLIQIFFLITKFLEQLSENSKQKILWSIKEFLIGKGLLSITKDASVKYFFMYSESSLSLFCNHPKNRIEVVVVFLGLVCIYLLRKKTRKLWWMLLHSWHTYIRFCFEKNGLSFHLSSTYSETIVLFFYWAVH